MKKDRATLILATCTVLVLIAVAVGPLAVGAFPASPAASSAAVPGASAAAVPAASSAAGTTAPPVPGAIGSAAISPVAQEAAEGVGFSVPDVVLRGIDFGIEVDGDPEAGDWAVRVNGETYAAELLDGALVASGVTVVEGGALDLEVLLDGAVVGRGTAGLLALPGWVSVVPPLLAILVALLFRNVIPALFFGTWFGAWAATGFSLFGLLSATLGTFETYVLEALTDEAHAAIILFSLMIGGMVGIISRNGGMQGVVDRITPWANSPTRGQVATGILGLVIFFDDYANVLVVGNTMRKVTDRLKISREKLAYVVDSTAAPVSCIALVTTWIGYEVGLIEDAVRQIGGFQEAAYSIFLNSIPYSFYPILAIFFVFVVASTHRDFGPMYDAEVRARTTGKLLADGASVDEAAAGGEEMEPKDGHPHRAVNALLPVGTLVATVLAGLFVTGEGETLQEVVGSADSYTALMWASLLGVLVAAILSLVQRILSLEEVVDAWYAGLKSMMIAMIILILAWSLSSITEVLYTAQYLVSILGEALVPGMVPALIFVLSAATAFATGSSWGTMGILMPLVLPLTWAVMSANAMTDPEHFHIIYSTVSCVLAGSVWGDHCSPISDTTILSSMASGCDHIDHVRTQLPYAFLVGLAALLLGTLPAGFGVPWWIGLLVGAGVVFSYNRFLGKPVDEIPVEAEVPVEA